MTTESDDSHGEPIPLGVSGRFFSLCSLRSPLFGALLWATSWIALCPLDLAHGQDSARMPLRVDTNTIVSAGEATAATEGELSAIVFRRDSEVAVSTSPDRGRTWNAPVRVDQDPTASFKWVATDGGTPSIAIVNGIMHVLWRDGRNGEDDLWHRRSLDGGLSWGIEHRLDKAYPAATAPVREYALTTTIEGTGGHIHVLLTVDPGSGGSFLPDELYLVSSFDNGASWGSARSVSTQNGSGADVDSFALDAQGMDLVITWSDDRFGTSTRDDLWLRRSLDGGLTFLAPEYQVDPSGPLVGDVENEIRLACEDGVLAIAWEEEFGSVREQAWVAISLDRGTNFLTAQRIGQYPLGSADVDAVALAIDAGTVFVGWDDDRLGPDEIRLQSSVDLGLTWSPEQTLSTSQGGDLRLVAGAGVVLAIWSGDAVGGGQDRARSSSTRDGGLNWSLAADLSTNSGDVDAARPVWNSDYRNLIVPWLADDSGTNGVWAGGYRPQVVTPMNWTSGGLAHLEFSGFSGDAPLAWVLGSAAPGSLPLPLGLGGRNLGLWPDSTLIFTLQNPGLFTSTLDASGFGATTPVVLPDAPGTVFYVAGLSMKLGPLSIDELTDVVQIIVQ
ncbi:MAG: hypothetical protein ACI8PQ_002281 [Planctomycetota bacterium]|jgi:hypothetical protein